MLKRIFVLIVVALPFAGAAQFVTPSLAPPVTNFTLVAKMPGITKPVQAYLMYQQNQANVIDSATFVGGNLQFSGSVNVPVNAILVVDHKGTGFSALNKTDDILSFYIEKGIITITGTDSVSKGKITGSPINDDNVLLTARLKDLNARGNKLYANSQSAARGEQTPAAAAELQARFKSLQKERETILKNFIQANSNSYLSLMALSSMGGPSANAAELETLFNGLSQTLKTTDAGKQLNDAILVLKRTGIGSMAPDFTQNDVNGKPVKLSSFRGKYVLLDFWASWCGPCRQENPNVVKAYNKYKDKNFTVFGVSLDRPGAKDAWINAIKADALNWTQVSDLKGWQNDAAGLYFVKSIPQNFLIDPQGKIVGKNLRGADLENKLAELLGTAEAPKGGE